VGDESLPLQAPPRDAAGRREGPVQLPSTLGPALAQVADGDPIWFDDGRIGGVVTGRTAGCLRVRVDSAPRGGANLGPDKGINLPQTRLDLPRPTLEDIADLEFAVAWADMVGFSFVEQPGDVLRLEELLEARGDLAVEVGFARLAEVQEQILWLCEAARVPVIWATQVLESLAKTGLPTRSEVSDAAMGVRAECMMLNKGPFIVDAVALLDDVLRRMQEHHGKKRALLRRLRSFN